MMRWNHHWLGDPKFKSKYGTLYTDIRYDGPPACMNWTGYHVIRRLVFAPVIVFLVGYPVFQIELLVMISLWLTAYSFAVCPMISKGHNTINNTNEFLTIFCIHYTFLFSNYNPYYPIRINLGYLYLVVVGTILIVNIAITLYMVMIDLRYQFKRCMMKR